MVTALYAGILTVFFVVLTFATIRMRIRHGHSLGDGGVDELHRYIRTHANFAEYIPFALLLMLLLELHHQSVLLLHILGVTLIIGRLCHMYSLTKTERAARSTMLPRQIGVFFTLIVMIIAALRLITLGI